MESDVWQPEVEFDLISLSLTLNSLTDITYVMHAAVL